MKKLVTFVFVKGNSGAYFSFFYAFLSPSFSHAVGVVKVFFRLVPTADWLLLKELIRKFGWQAETREQMLDRFVSSRPAEPALNEEEIMDEVRAVRYAKK